jgi:hypothetical protein
MTIHPRKKFPDEAPGHLSGGNTFMKVGMGIAALLGLAIVFAVMTGPRNNVTSPYGQDAGQKQEMPAVPPVR